MSPSVMQELEGFHVNDARQLTSMRPWKVKGGWVYQHSDDDLATTHLQPIKYYIQKRRHTVHNTIQDPNVLKECRGAETRRSIPPCLFWVRQDMEEPVRREYREEGGGTLTPPAASHMRVAPQARPTVAVEERPREAMPFPDADATGHGPKPILMISRMGMG